MTGYKNVFLKMNDFGSKTEFAYLLKFLNQRAKSMLAEVRNPVFALE